MQGNVITDKQIFDDDTLWSYMYMYKGVATIEATEAAASCLMYKSCGGQSNLHSSIKNLQPSIEILCQWLDFLSHKWQFSKKGGQNNAPWLSAYLLMGVAQKCLQVVSTASLKIQS